MERHAPGARTGFEYGHFKAHPGKINFASSGAGSNGHLSILLLQEVMHIDVLHVPYKGAGPAVLEEAFFTCRIDAGWRFEVNDAGDVLLSKV